MRRLAIIAGLALAGSGLRGQGTVELPPMMVEETVSSAPWLYVSVGGAEFLSRCSDSTTRQFVEAWLEKMQLVQALVPAEFLPRSDVPTLLVLYSQNLQQTVSAEIQRELQGAEGRAAPRGDRVNIAPNMRLTDRDLHASIVYLDEAQFNAAGLSIAPGHVRFLLKGRVPELPAWLVDGVERIWRDADFVLDPITIRPLVWLDARESAALASDAQRPRALLPAGELFAPEPARAVENRHPRRAEIRAAQQELFFRWALLGGAATRAALWRLAARAAEGPVTEDVFEQCFGFGFADLRDRLSDYLPKAVKETQWIKPGPPPPAADFAVTRATPNQVARIRGEWERLAIAHVQRRLPQVREPYIAQARRTLRRAFDAGDRDPRLLATMGLVELDAGNAAGARQYLDPACAAGVPRPRAHHELAWLRFAELRRDTPETKLFSFTELAPVLEPLRRAAQLAPPLPEAFALLGEAWARCELAPNAAELAELGAGARAFVHNPAVAWPIAAAYARHGRPAEALAALEACAGYPADEATAAGIARLRAGLAGAAPRLLNGK